MEWAESLLYLKESVGVYLITGGLPDQEEVQWVGHVVGGACGGQCGVRPASGGVFAAGAAL